MVRQTGRKELQRNHSGQAVVDIIERAFINVQLPLPTRTASIKAEIAKIIPGPILLFKFQPCLVALFGGHRFILVDNMLKFIHHASIRKKDKTVLCMVERIFGSIRAKEELMPGSSQEFH